jgi:hypothetical protein
VSLLAHHTLSVAESTTLYTNTTARVNKHASTAEGDLMVVEILTDTGSASFTTLEGWTLQQTSTGGSNFQHPVYTKVMGASEPSTYDFTCTDHAGMKFTRSTTYRKTGGTWTVSSVVADETGTSAATLATGNITGKAGGVLHVGFANDSAFTVSSDPSGMTLIATQSADSMALSSWYQTGTTATTYNKSITWSANEQMGAVALAIGAE